MRRSVMTLEKASPRTRERIGYLDLLRAAALLRVVTYHMLGWTWLHIFIPAIGVMFALAGSLMADSLSRRPPSQARPRRSTSLSGCVMESRWV